MTPRYRPTGRPGRFLTLTALLASILFIAGCAGTSGGNQRSAAANDPAAQCRAAIADVSKMCAGEGAESRDCNAAKSRSRNLCITE